MLDADKTYSMLSILALPGGGFLVTDQYQERLAAFSVIEDALEFIETYLGKSECL